MKLDRYTFKLLKLIYLKIKDIKYVIENGRPFDLYGLTVFVGKQGSGKTISMVDYLERMKRKYPKSKIYTNFNYSKQDGILGSWEMIFSVRNGLDGVIFAIDEIQNEYDSTKWKDFPEGLLSQVTMQRKQKIKILSSSQVFNRMVKQLREQSFEVVECKTIMGRYTRNKAYDAWDYEDSVDAPERRRKLPKLWTWSFIQDSYLRGLYDTDLVIENMAKIGVLPREVRLGNR